MFIGYYVCIGLILISILISIGAQVKVTSTYSKFQKEASSLGITGEELAYSLARQSNVAIKVRSCKGRLTDHYDPRDKSLNISQENMHSDSIASLAVVAHEFGHALQDEENYFPFKVRQASVKIANFMSGMLIPMIIIGVLVELFLFAGVGSIFIYVMVGVYTISFIVSLVTIPVEYNASARAKKLLVGMGGTSEKEINATSEVLNSAALTYVASMLVNLAYLLRLLYILQIFNRD